MPARKKVELASPVKASSTTKVQGQKLAPQFVGQNGEPLTRGTVQMMIDLALADRATNQVSPMDDDGPSPSTIKSKRGDQVKAAGPTTPVSEAMANLQNAVGEAHSNMQFLIDLLEPHLPRHLFSDCDEGQAQSGTPSRVCYSENNSMTVNDINNQTNEIDRLGARINFLRSHVIV